MLERGQQQGSNQSQRLQCAPGKRITALSDITKDWFPGVNDFKKLEYANKQRNVIFGLVLGFGCSYEKSDIMEIFQKEIFQNYIDAKVTNDNRKLLQDTQKSKPT